MRKDILERQKEIKTWIDNHTPKAEMCRRLDCRIGTLNNYLQKMGIYYKGNQGNLNISIISNEDIFNTNSPRSTGFIKSRILAEELIPHKCNRCGIDEWLGDPIVLELDHINGNNTDQRLENLQFLCPNCHSQTPTFRGRNINGGMKKVSDETLCEALDTTDSIRQALIKVGLSPQGGNYKRAKKMVRRAGLEPARLYRQ